MSKSDDRSIIKKPLDQDGLYVVDNEDELEKELEAANMIKKMELNVC